MVPDRYRALLLAALKALAVLLVAVLALVGVAVSDLGDDTTAPPPTSTATTAPATTVPPTTITPTTVAPTTTSTTTAPTTTTVPPAGPDGDVDSGVNVDDHLIRAWEPNPSADYPAFRVFCEFSHLAFDDPIVRPGLPGASHLHAFFGNVETDGNSTYRSLRSSGDSTCDGGPLNRTGYWMPAVFDAAGRVVVPSNIEVYYKAENANDPADVAEFPNGLRMVAGAGLVAGEGSPAATFGWNCGSGAAGRVTIPDCEGARLVATVRFPYCWDGRNLDSPDHRSHMAFTTDNNTWGTCPASHPVHLPEITELFHYNGATGSDEWTLSSDMGAAGGSTLHADWFGAWEDSIETQWVGCIRARRNLANGNLCDGTQLRAAPNYTGPARLDGWTPMIGRSADG